MLHQVLVDGIAMGTTSVAEGDEGDEYKISWGEKICLEVPVEAETITVAMFEVHPKP